MVARREAPAFTRCQVDDDVDGRVANAVNDLTVEIHSHAPLPCFRIAHVNVDDGGTRPSSADGSRRNFVRSHGQLRMMLSRHDIAGDSARNDGFLHNAFMTESIVS